MPAHVEDDAPDESMTISAPRYTGTSQPAHTLPPLQMSANPDLQTMEGRAQRDEIAAQSSNPDARIKFDVHLPHGKSDWSQVSSNEASAQAVRQYAATHDIPAGFTEKWLEANGAQNHLYDSQGKTVEPADLIFEGSPHYDFERRTLRVSQELPQLKKLRDDYMASLPAIDRAGEFMFDGQRSPGEKLLDVAAPVVGPITHGGELASRVVAAAPDAAVWSKLRSGSLDAGDIDPLTAYAILQALTGGDLPGYAKNPMAEGVRHSQTLANINPRLPSLLGGITEAVTSPSNLLGIGAGKAGLQALKSLRLGAGVAAGLAEAMGGESKLAEFFSRGGRVLDIERAAVDAKAAGAAADGLLVTLKDEAGNLSCVNTATGEVSEVKTLPRVLGMSVPDALEKHPTLDRHVAERLANAESRAAGFETEAGRADLPDDYRRTHAEEAARAHDEAAYLKDVQAAIEEHRNPSAQPVEASTESHVPDEMIAGRPVSEWAANPQTDAMLADRIGTAQSQVNALDVYLSAADNPVVQKQAAAAREELSFFQNMRRAVEDHRAAA
ncbi:MAG: hypothetical protein WCD76_05550, partial [Pyrinomonadaceae bacterium]